MTAEILTEAAFAAQVTFGVDAEFEQVAPPLTDAESAALEREVLEHGILAPLVTWCGVLVDGHNRFRLARRHRLAFAVVEVALEDRGAVVTWICDQALARRSLTPLAAAYLRGKRYESAKSDVAVNLAAKSEPGSPKGQIDPLGERGRTDERLAKVLGVGAKTIRRDAEFARQLDDLAARAGVDVRNAILSRRLPLTRSDVREVVSRSLIDEAAIRQYSDEARAKRRRAPRPAAGEEPAAFFQREIEEWLTDAGGKVCAVRLSCGHREPYKPRGDGPSGAKTKACKACGSGSRTVHEKRMQLAEWDDLVMSAARDPERRRHLVACVMGVQALLATAPISARQRQIWGKLDHHAAHARVFCHSDYTQSRSA